MHSSSEFAVEARELRKTYTQGKLWQRKIHCCALDGVNLALRPGTTLGIVGESGSGKTTLAMCLVGLTVPDAGAILVGGVNLQSLKKAERISAQGEIQLIFQDSAGALNPRMSASEIVEEPLLIRGQHTQTERRDLASGMMEKVGLSAGWGHRRPNELSGGQRQRLAIARSLVLRPRVLILDEVFAGLDLSIQGQIANLLLDLQQVHQLSYICISHDLNFTAQFADTIAVMSRGRIVEQESAGSLSAKFQKRSRAISIRTPEEGSALAAHSGA
jgi:ABC-type glutathione transport system ATPase component